MNDVFASAPAMLPMTFRTEIGLALAVIVTCAGVVLHWRLPRQRMAIEEMIKNGKLSPAAAASRVRWLHVMAPTVTILGVLMLIGVVLAIY